MTQLIRLFWQICLLKKGPADVPHSVFLLSAVLFLNGFMACLQFATREGLALGLLLTVVMLSLSAVFTYAVLKIKHYTNRFVQTLTTLTGANLLINICVLPLLLLQPFFTAAGPTPEGGMLLLGFLLMLFVIGFNVWLIMVTAHIYGRALDTSFLIGLLVTIALLGLDIIVFSQFYTPPVT